jgi:hypothetical protein
MPTLAGSGLLLILSGIVFLLWWFKAEPFLASTNRVAADVLVVEGWIGVEGVRAAADEFRSGAYRYVVATGGLTGAPWTERRWSHAEVAQQALILAGIPQEQVILARPPDDVHEQRTHASASAVRRALEANTVTPTAINVFTRSVHARRSRLVFAKAFETICPVGSVAWMPPGSEDPAWWRYSYRADDVLKESVGYLFELVFGSGRSFAGSERRN